MKYLHIISFCAASVFAILCVTACGTQKSVTQSTESGIQTETAPAAETASAAETANPEPEQPQPEPEEAAETATPPENNVPDTEDAAPDAEPEQSQASTDTSEEDIPADFIRCEITISKDGIEYNAQAAGPTIEEARDNAAEEACAITCSPQIEQLQLSEEETEARLDECTEKCAASVNPIGEVCFQNGQNIYTSGVMSEPTAGQQE